MEPICLVLQLFKKNDNHISYQVDDSINKAIFYVNIDLSEKIIYFFKDKNFSHPLGNINLNLKQISAISSIKNNIVLMLSTKIFKNIKDNIFPEKINIVSL
jgi:uncharacterized protein YukJ